MLPLEVVEERPHVVPAHVDARADRALDGRDVAAEILDALWVLDYPMTATACMLLYFDLGGRLNSTRSIVDFARLPNGTVALVALVVGFVVGIPFQNSSLGYSWGGPFNYITATYLHGADLAYYVGGAVAFLIYWFGARSVLRRA